MPSNEAALIDYVANTQKHGPGFPNPVEAMQAVVSSFEGCDDKDVVIPKFPPYNYRPKGYEKRVAMLCPNWNRGGCATSAANWTRTVNEYSKGWSAELVVITKSGKPGVHYRKDHTTTLLPCGKRSGPEFATNYLNDFDLVVVWGVDDQTPNTRFQQVMPFYSDVILGIKAPLLVYYPNLFDLEDTAVLVREVMKMPNVVAIGSMRSNLLKTVREAPFVNEDLPAFLFLHHPEEITGFIPNTNFQRPEGRPRLVQSMTRIAYSKRPRIIVRAFRDLLRDHPDLGLDYEMWGAVMGREIWKMEKDLPDSKELAPILKQRYFGGYDTNNVGYIYERGCFSIDLTRMIGDGGMQNASMESMTHGVIPIVPEGWNVTDGMVALPIPNDEKKMNHDQARGLLVDTLVTLDSVASKTLVEMQRVNWEWIRDNRHPHFLAATFERFMDRIV
jgi:hypothetical protein